MVATLPELTWSNATKGILVEPVLAALLLPDRDTRYKLPVNKAKGEKRQTQTLHVLFSSLVGNMSLSGCILVIIG